MSFRLSVNCRQKKKNMTQFKTTPARKRRIDCLFMLKWKQEAKHKLKYFLLKAQKR